MLLFLTYIQTSSLSPLLSKRVWPVQFVILEFIDVLFRPNKIFNFNKDP